MATVVQAKSSRRRGKLETARTVVLSGRPRWEIFGLFRQAGVMAPAGAGFTENRENSRI